MKTKGNNIAQLKVGEMVDALRIKKRITHAVLARRLGRKQPGIAKFLQNSSIQTYLVWELSVALGHNFFTDLAQLLDAATEGRLEKQESELHDLKMEYARLKEERDYLRKAVDLISK